MTTPPGRSPIIINDVSVTNNLAVLTPYVVTFRGFSAELASVLAGFAASPHGFIVKGINVQPAGAAAQAGDNSAPAAAGAGGRAREKAVADGVE